MTKIIAQLQQPENNIMHIFIIAFALYGAGYFALNMLSGNEYELAIGLGLFLVVYAITWFITGTGE